MSVDHFYCFLWVKILWDINLKHLLPVFLYVCVCLCTNIHKTSKVYLCPGLHGPICKDSCWQRCTFFFLILRL